jgi:hypothetical protein
VNGINSRSPANDSVLRVKFESQRIEDKLAQPAPTPATN